MTLNKEANHKYCENQPWYKYITVEPVMFLYMMAFMITNVIEQTFYVFQACRVNHGYSDDICYNISIYEDINKEVQITVSTFHQWNGIASHVVPLLLAFFLGSYSDKRGRKIIILAGLLGKLFFSMMITINTMYTVLSGDTFPDAHYLIHTGNLEFFRLSIGTCFCFILLLIDWPVEYIIYSAALPSALTGADLAIFAGCFAYIADTSSLKNRTLRVGILDVVYLSAMPLGVALGNVLYNKVLDRSFTGMFAINTSLMICATIYAFVFLAWQTRPEQKSLIKAGVKNPITDFFDWNNIMQTIATLTKKRTNNRRLFLWVLLASMAFYTFQRDERPVMYLYTTVVFKWNATTFSHFRAFLSTLYVLAMLFGIPLFTKFFRWRDTLIVMLGATSHIAGHLVYAHATVGKMLYAGAIAASLGPCVAPLIRSMTSKILPPAERGVAYAFLSVMENAVAMFASIVYSQIYKATLDTNYMNAIFYLTISTQVIVILCSFTMEIMLNGRKLESIMDHDEKRISA